MVCLSFDKGSLLIKGNIRTPYGKWDSRVGAYRAKSMHYADILDFFKESNFSLQDNVIQGPPIEVIENKIKLREYQEQALLNWNRNKKRGVIVLPTAAGKTFIALKAISDLKTQTLIIVPTLDLIDQWKDRIKEHLGIESGVIGGGDNFVKMVTISTYRAGTTSSIHCSRLLMLRNNATSRSIGSESISWDFSNSVFLKPYYGVEHLSLCI